MFLSELLVIIFQLIIDDFFDDKKIEEILSNNYSKVSKCEVIGYVDMHW